MKANERLEAKKQRQNTIIVGVAAVVVLVLVIAGVLFLFNGGPGEGATATFGESQLDASGQNVLIPLANITDNSFHFFSYDAGGMAVKYFVVKDKDGTAHTAFDACDVCFRSRKGYRQSGDFAKCNNCGRTFPVYGLGTKNTGGGCWPGYLHHEVQGNNILIKISDLEGGRRYF